MVDMGGETDRCGSPWCAQVSRQRMSDSVPHAHARPVFSQAMRPTFGKKTLSGIETFLR
jgi:hypothetical protein